MKFLNNILTLLPVSLLILFTMQNWTPIDVSFFNYALEIPVSLIALFCYVVGTISGGFLIPHFRNEKSDRED